MSQKIYSDLDIKGSATVRSIPNATLDTDKFLVSDNGLIKYRTGNELLADLGVDIGAPAARIQHVVKAAVAINKGQAIYISGADGTNMLASLASNISEATSSKTMGLLDATVAINGFANVVTEGLIEGLDTSTAVIGNPVWLGTNGNLIYGLINKPYAPAHLVFIGIVTRVNLNNGEIFVKVQNGFELDEIHDIDLKTTIPINGHLLGYNGTLWVNKTIAGWLGYTPADDANVVHKTGNETVAGDKIFTGTTYLNTSAITGREALLTASVSDNTTDKFFLANGTTTANRFIPTFVGYTSGAYQALLFRGLGASADDLSDTAPYIQFLAANTNSSTDPNNGTLSTPTARDLFSWSTTGGTDYMKIKAGGIVLINTTVSNGIDRLQIDGYTLSTGYKIPSGLSTWFLKADGSYDTTTYQTAITNPLTGTGTVNYVSKFTGTGTTLGDSLIFDNGTKVGIGTTSPAFKLQVKTPTLLIGSTYSWPFDLTRINDTQRGFSIGLGVANEVVMGSHNSDMAFGHTFGADTNGNPIFFETMRIQHVDQAVGNVGIGTTSPNTPLHVRGTIRAADATGLSGITLVPANNTIGVGGGTAVEVSGSNIYFGNAQNFLHLRTTSTTRLYIGATGNVGIGTTNPTEKLEVVGTIKSTSSVQVGDNSLAASSTNVGAIRYRSDANNSYMDMVMQIGASTYAWVNVVQNTW